MAVVPLWAPPCLCLPPSALWPPPKRGRSLLLQPLDPTAFEHFFPPASLRETTPYSWNPFICKRSLAVPPSLTCSGRSGAAPCQPARLGGRYPTRAPTLHPSHRILFARHTRGVIDGGTPLGALLLLGPCPGAGPQSPCAHVRRSRRHRIALLAAGLVHSSHAGPTSVAIARLAEARQRSSPTSEAKLDRSCANEKGSRSRAKLDQPYAQHLVEVGPSFVDAGQLQDALALDVGTNSKLSQMSAQPPLEANPQ